MMNRNISPWEKECMYKQEQRRHWSPKMHSKVQEYDCNWKQQQAEQSKSTTTPPVTDRKQKIKCKVNLQQNEKGFKKSVKKLFTIGLNSPKKKDFMFDYFEKRGIKIKCEECAKD